MLANERSLMFRIAYRRLLSELRTALQMVPTPYSCFQFFFEFSYYEIPPEIPFACYKERQALNIMKLDIPLTDYHINNIQIS